MSINFFPCRCTNRLSVKLTVLHVILLESLFAVAMLESPPPRLLLQCVYKSDMGLTVQVQGAQLPN